MDAHPFEQIYGAQLKQHKARYAALRRQFQLAFQREPTDFFRAPGRVNLIGGHTDYNQGFALPLAIDRDVIMAMGRRSDGIINVVNAEAAFAPFQFEIGMDLERQPAGHWSNYARGVAQLMAQQQPDALHGFDAVVSSKSPFGIPRGAGLSSSSALTVLFALGLAHVNRWQPDIDALINFCSEAEWFVGTRGGMMDHFTSLSGVKNAALLLDCRPDDAGRYRTEEVEIPAGVSILIVDSGVKHSNVSGHFNRRVAACRAGVALLKEAGWDHVVALRDVAPADWQAANAILPPSTTIAQLNARGIELGELPGLEPDDPFQVAARCRHIVAENDRVHQMVAALRRGDVVAAGQLLTQAHDSVSGDYGIGCPETDMLAAIIDKQAGVYGKRLVGGGWGGTIIALVDAANVVAVRDQILGQYEKQSGIKTDAFASQPGPGASGVILPTHEE